jgi:flagellar biosynthesis protein FlhG
MAPSPFLPAALRPPARSEGDDRQAPPGAWPAGRPTDQAHGLRRLFAAPAPRHLALLANPHVPATGVVLERLGSTLAALGLHALVVDAASSASAPHELAALDLAACIEPLGPQLSYLAARGLPLAHVDARGSAGALLALLDGAAPQADLLLLHADAVDLVRLFGRALPPTLLLAGGTPESLTHAYAGCKLLVQRCGRIDWDLLLALPPRHPLARRIAVRLGSCAERFLGAVVHESVVLDPQSDPRAPLPPALQRLLAALLLADDEADPAGAAAPSSHLPPGRDLGLRHPSAPWAGPSPACPPWGSSQAAKPHRPENPRRSAWS